MASDLAENLMRGKKNFGARVVDALLPSLVSAIGSAMMVGYVSLKVIEVRLDEMQKKVDANSIAIDIIKVNYAGVAGSQVEYVKRLDAALGAINQLNDKMDARITFIERRMLEQHGK